MSSPDTVSQEDDDAVTVTGTDSETKTSKKSNEVLTPERLISVFIQSNDNDEDNIEINQEELDCVIALLLKQKITDIYDPLKLDELNKGQLLIKYFCSILIACFTVKNDTSSLIRYHCFVHSIKYLKNGASSATDSKELLSGLSIHYRFIRASDAKKCADRILNDIDPRNQCELDGLSHLLDLLCQLTSKVSASDRSSLIESLCSSSWYSKTIVMQSNALVEMCESEDECVKALQKMNNYIKLRRPVNRSSSSSNKGNGDSNYNNIDFGDDDDDDDDNRARSTMIEPEELPSLLYQIVLVGKKCGGTSVRLKAKVVDIVAHAIDILLNTATFIARSNNDPTGFVKQIDAILATILHHLSISTSKDEGITNHILYFIKNRNLTKQTIDNTHTMSPGRLMLCLLAARSPRYEDKILNCLCEVIVEVYNVQTKINRSIWFKESSWRQAINIAPSDLPEVFQAILVGSLVNETIAYPLTTLAFSLIEIPRLAAKSAWHQLTSSSSVLQPKEQTCSKSAGDLGSWLLTQLFARCDHARAHIIRELISRLVINSNNTSLSSNSGVAASVADACVSILLKLVKASPDALVESSKELQEAFLSLPDLYPSTASKLVNALSQLFPRCSALSDRCALALRKATFSQDNGCRQSAVSALLALLRCLISQSISGGGINNRRRLTTSMMSSLGRSSSSPLSVDEILSLLRRFMTHQAKVRGLLYEELYKLQNEFPVLREMVLKLLLGHVHSLIQDDGFDRHIRQQQPLMAATGSRGSLPLVEDMKIRIDLNACLDISNKPQERIGLLLLTLLSIANDANPSMNATIETDIHAYNDNGIASSQGALSQGSQCNTQAMQYAVSQAATEVYLIVWNIVKSNADYDLADFEIDDEEDAVDLHAHNKVLLMIDSIQASIICTLNIPSHVGHAEILVTERFRILKKLSIRLHNLQALSARQVAKKKKESSELRKREKNHRDCGNYDANIAAATETAAVVFTDTSAAGDNSGAYHHKPYYILKNELLFTAICLDLIIPLSEDDIEADEEADTQPSGTATGNTQGIANEYLLYNTNELIGCRTKSVLRQKTLHMYTLDQAIVGLEHFLLLLHDLDVHKDDEACYAINYSNIRNLRVLTEELFLILSKDLHYQIAMIAYDDEDIISGNKSVIKEENKRKFDLILRGMLGCVRVQVAAAALGNGALLANDKGVYGPAGSSTSMFDRLNTLVDTLQSTLYSNTSGINYRQTNATATASATAADGNALMKNVKLLFSLVLEVQKREDSLGLSATVISIIGELIVAAPTAERQKAISFLFTRCHSKIKNPSNTLSKALIQFFVLLCPSSPIERLNRLNDIALLIKQCAAEKSRHEDENINNNESLPTYTVIGMASYSSSLLCFLGILDKAYMETDSLMKWCEKKKKAVVSRLHSDDGHISSDDNDDDMTQQRHQHENPMLTGSNQLIWVALNKIMEAGSHLILNNIDYSPESAELIVSFFTKLYKILVRITRGFIQHRVVELPLNYRSLIKLACDCNTNLEKFINQLHNMKRGCSDADTVNGKKQKKSINRDKLAKIIPDLTFQMEQLDLQLIKLVGIVRDKSFITQLIKEDVTGGRGFKVNANKLPARMHSRNGNDDGDDDRSNNKRQKRRSSDGSKRGDDDDDTMAVGDD